MPLSSAESRRASPSQRLLSRANMQGEARKKYTTSLLNDQRNSNRKKLSKRHKQLGITDPCFTSTFFRGKELFYWARVRSDNAEDDDRLLQNNLGEPLCCTLHCSGRTEFFPVSLTKHVIPVSSWELSPSLWLELVVMDFALNKSYFLANQSLSLTSFSHLPF